ncbi:universal stress PHOS32 [Olea europaea subsp. europaea]|uniref:Universal stress PHOS32 n=1 Tax=Olea europaea subsp. europaea TaxID=158383 RepID=A0A8S0UIN1_OLEEU|nr:universal stress PHOS32 [Olea europaea subsp. europaea]
MEDYRRVGVAIDFSPCSRKALEWTVNNIVRKGDHLILVTVLREGHYEEGEAQLWQATGSPLIPLIEFTEPHTMKKYGVNPDPETLDIVATASRQKEVILKFTVIMSTLGFTVHRTRFELLFAFLILFDVEQIRCSPFRNCNIYILTMQITVLLKIFWGDAREKICESVESIPLECLVIGNRGLGKIKRAIMGSVSNYVVNNATCPITVVKIHD